MLEVSVLGPLEVRRDGVPVPIPGGKTAELLVRLALEAGLVVRADRLVDELWGADAVNTRRNTLQSKVTRLRRALGDPLAISGADGGYRLAVAPPAVDALAVLRDAGAAAALLHAADDRGAAELSAAVLARFRGDVLPAAGDGDWAGPHRARLEEARAKLVETRLSARLRMGEAGDLVVELEDAVAVRPYQEGLWELLVTALYRAGRQAEALAAYRRIRTLLADELGLDPGPRLRRLERQVLEHDPALLVEVRATHPAPEAGPGPGSDFGPPAGNLPSLAAELVGREAEIEAVSELLARERLVEIVGPGGIGKTALAIATARRLAAAGARAPGGGVWLARLESATTTDDVLDTLIAALGVSGGEAALFERLRGAACLIVLDNCEHVLDAAAALAVRLLDGAPGLRILCTSQAPLDVDGETVFELVALELADAVELFTRRARRSDRPAAADQVGGSETNRLRNLDAVRELCRALDGLPLAIELAAARTRTLSIADITRRLDDRFSVLSDPASRRPQRRRALKATIAWSYDLLFPDDQRGLWALATFAGGASPAALESVLAALDVPASTAIDVVGRLASRSLVIVDQVGGSEKDRLRNLDQVGGSEENRLRRLDGASGLVRYRLLDSIRAFALEAMSDAGLTERARAAHAAWFAAAARISTDGVRSARQAEHLAVARAERANLDAALEWAAAHDPPLALAVASGFGWAWIVLGDSRGAQRILAALDAAGDAAPPRDGAQALLLAAWIEASTGRLELAREHIAAASGLADAVGDVDLRARCCYYLAYVVSHRGEWSRALELTDRSDALYEGLDRPWDQAANWLFAARAAISARDGARAREARDEVDRWLSSVDDPWLQVRREAMLGELARIELRFEDAVRHLGRAAETSARLGFLQTEAYQVSSLGRAQCQAGDHPAAAATLACAIAKADATGDVRLAALARVHLGRVLRALGRIAEARTALEAAAAWHREAGGGEQAALGDCLLAALDALDDVDAAQPRLDAILAEARAAGDAPVEVFALDALARIATQRGEVALARELCDTADGLMQAAGHFISDLDRVDARAVRQIA